MYLLLCRRSGGEEGCRVIVNSQATKEDVVQRLVVAHLLTSKVSACWEADCSMAVGSKLADYASHDAVTCFFRAA